MKKALCILLFALPMLAQKPFPIDDHVGVRVVPKFNPGAAGIARDHMEMKKDGIIHRVLRDSGGKILFAYDIEVKPKDAFYHILTEPVSAAYAQTLQFGSVPTLSAVSDSVTISGGSVIIELLSNPATGQKISDDIELVDISPAGSALDGNLHIWNADLWLNGTKLTSGSINEGALNAVVERLAIYLPRSGGFFFSLLQPAEYPQFQKIGVVNGKVLKFAWGNKTFELRSTVPILSNGASGEVWVFHDSQFRPKDDLNANMTWGGAPAMKTWLGNEEEN